MTRRFAARVLAGTLATTVAGATGLGLFVGPGAAVAFSFAGLLVTWVVCVRCWRTGRRPRLFRLVCAPIGQLWGALFFPVLASVDVRAEDEPLAIVAGWLMAAGVFVFMSVLFAGFLRNVNFSSHGGAGGGV